MKKLNFDIHMTASAAKVWQVLWDDTTYRQWTTVFNEGSYAVSDWKEGSNIQFLNADGSGMYSTIVALKTNEHMVFKHLGAIKNFEEQLIDEKTKLWSGGLESYTLKQEDKGLTLTAGMEAPEDFLNYFSDTFPKALILIKEIAEHPIVLSIETTVNTSIEKIWSYFTQPSHITKWNAASEDWHSPHAINDLKAGGNFVYRMEAKDGSFGFDFSGTYTKVEAHKSIQYALGDGRTVTITFTKQNNGYKITEEFDAEEVNPLSLQRGGWQAILENFKTYTENN